MSKREIFWCAVVSLFVAKFIDGMAYGGGLPGLVIGFSLFEVFLRIWLDGWHNADKR